MGRHQETMGSKGKILCEMHEKVLDLSQKATDVRTAFKHGQGLFEQEEDSVAGLQWLISAVQLIDLGGEEVKDYTRIAKATKEMRTIKKTFGPLSHHSNFRDLRHTYNEIQRVDRNIGFDVRDCQKALDKHNSLESIYKLIERATGHVMVNLVLIHYFTRLYSAVALDSHLRQVFTNDNFQPSKEKAVLVDRLAGMTDLDKAYLDYSGSWLQGYKPFPAKERVQAAVDRRL